MIERFHKSPHPATVEDTRWFWKDMDQEEGWAYDLAKDWISNWDIFLKLNEQYPFELTEWLMEWYSYMPEALSYKLDGAGTIDWNLFFTLIYPLPSTKYPFICLIKAVNVKQNQIVREQIFDTISKDPELSKRVLNNEVIPSIYTHYTTYKRIRREVVKRTRAMARTVQCFLASLL